MFYEDLSTQCQIGAGPMVRAVGWLSSDHPFPTFAEEQRDALFAQALQGLLRLCRWLPFALAGPHFCEFCPPLPSGGRIGGAQNLVVPAGDLVYLAPELIEHYVAVHRYQPPEEFVAAVLAARKPGDAGYRDAFRPFLGIWGITDEMFDHS